MQVTMENDGEKKTVTVQESGQVYIGKKYEGKEVELAIEVQDE